MTFAFAVQPRLVLLAIFVQLVRATPVVFWTNDPTFPSTPVSLSRLSASNLITERICALKSNEIHLHLLTVDDLQTADVQRALKNNDGVAPHYFPHVADDIGRTLALLPRSNQYECSHIHFRIDSQENFDTLDAALRSAKEIATNAKNTFLIALSRSSTLSRRRRATEEKHEVLFSADGSCMLYVENLLWNNGDGRKSEAKEYELDLNGSSCTPNDTSSQNRLTTVKLNWLNGAKNVSVRMGFQAHIINRYWYIENITVNDQPYRYFAFGMHDRMDTPPSYSYACNSALFVRYRPETKYGTYNFSDKFYLENFQFQPFRGDRKKFGPVNSCTSFFTSGIWMGITSSLLCLGILLFGIHRMMSIKSNDRFDDPKGKPLLIKAQE